VRLCLLALKQYLSDRPLLSMAVQRAAENAANQFLQPFGMFCRACSVGDYNSYPTVQGSRIRTIVHPETLEPILPSRILLVLGNDGGAWIPFISWLRQQPTLEDTPDSFDAFTSHVVHLLMQHLEAAGHSSLFWRQDTQTRPYTVIVQAAAHVSGMAHYETQLMWARHPVYAPACLPLPTTRLHLYNLTLFVNAGMAFGLAFVALLCCRMRWTPELVPAMAAVLTCPRHLLPMIREAELCVCR